MKILITDDHKIVRDGLKEILKNSFDDAIIEEAGNGKEALAKFSEGNFDMVLLDIALPDMTGLEVLSTIRSRNPQQNVLMLSMYPQEQYAVRSLKSGASGYLTKDSASEELIRAVKKIVSGGKYITQALAGSIAMLFDRDFEQPLHESLSEREFEIMLKIAAGKSLKEIGEDLFISGKTVSTYRSRIMEKMRMTKNAEITHYCLKNGLLG